MFPPIISTVKERIRITWSSEVLRFFFFKALFLAFADLRIITHDAEDRRTLGIIIKKRQLKGPLLRLSSNQRKQFLCKATWSLSRWGKKLSTVLGIFSRCVRPQLAGKTKEHLVRTILRITITIKKSNLSSFPVMFLQRFFSFHEGGHLQNLPDKNEPAMLVCHCRPLKS